MDMDGCALDAVLDAVSGCVRAIYVSRLTCDGTFVIFRPIERQYLHCGRLISQSSSFVVILDGFYFLHKGFKYGFRPIVVLHLITITIITVIMSEFYWTCTEMDESYSL